MSGPLNPNSNVHKEATCHLDCACDPFFGRVLSMTERWVAAEWADREAIRRAAMKHGWTEQHRTDYEAAILTAENLAHRLDNISISKLRRELRKLGAPTPGEIIRAARIDHAKHLLVTTRLLVREISERSGYDSEKHFATQFQRATGVTPSAYRRNGIAEGVRMDRNS